MEGGAWISPGRTKKVKTDNWAVHGGLGFVFERLPGGRGTLKANSRELTELRSAPWTRIVERDIPKSVHFGRD